jgi:hypothetical protein
MITVAYLTGSFNLKKTQLWAGVNFFFEDRLKLSFIRVKGVQLGRPTVLKIESLSKLFTKNVLTKKIDLVPRT